MNPESDEPKNEGLLDLNFVPTWARQPPQASPFGDFSRDAGGSDRPPRRFDERRDSRRDRDRRDRPPRRDEGSREGRRFGRDSGRGGRPSASGAPEPPRDAGGREWGGGRESRPDALPPLLPVEVAFVPERAGLVAIARRIAKVGRAFSLFDVASLFLNQPAYLTIKLTPAAAGGPVDGSGSLCQCRECQQVFADLGQAVAHVMARHLERFYRRDEETVDPPQGAFVCVARCGLSGELLGPPNYHSFNDRVVELHRTRFSHLSMDDYRRRIENVHDAALIDQWKEQMKKRTVFRVVAEPDRAPLESFPEVEAHFLATYAAAAVKAGAAFTLPGAVTRDLEDRRLRRTVMEAWHRESRFPLRLSITLRLAFRHLGLHIFRTAAGGNFVTAIVPQALDPETAIPPIREILTSLEAHPGLDKAGLLEQLRPGEAAESPAVHELFGHLRWLVDKGHVIEFSDGRLAVPRNAVRKVQTARRDERRTGGGGAPEETAP